MKNIHIIKSVVHGSIADELELKPGDAVCKINNKEIEDVFDYHYLINDEYVLLSVITKEGEAWEVEIEKDFDEDLGIVFDTSLMSEYKSCSNKCIFCFIDQLPKGMRDTMYFKDDDSRLSFLQGNYITLTNMKDKDLDRIIRYRLEPINISVHTTNPELRCKMLHNRFAGRIMEQLQKLYDHQIQMNSQIVLCKHYNDGEELERSLSDLSHFLPYLESISVVPMGMTKYREGLTQVEPFTAEDAKEVIAIIEKWQTRMYEEYGTHFVHAGDEWYLMAGLPVPEEERYDGYLQLENGVGMIRLLVEEYTEALQTLEESDEVIAADIITGKLAYPTICSLIDQFKTRYKNAQIKVHMINNQFFGESITVTGLITGQDVIAQLTDQCISNHVLMPINMLRSGEQVLLDDISIEDIENALQVKIDIIESCGKDLIDKLLKQV